MACFNKYQVLYQKYRISKTKALLAVSKKYGRMQKENSEETVNTNDGEKTEKIRLFRSRCPEGELWLVTGKNRQGVIITLICIREQLVAGLDEHFGVTVTEVPA